MASIFNLQTWGTLHFEGPAAKEFTHFAFHVASLRVACSCLLSKAPIHIHLAALCAFEHHVHCSCLVMVTECVPKQP